MGDRGKNEEMKQRKPVELDSMAPEPNKPDAQDPMGKPVSPTPHKTDVRLGREVQARIGQQLRAMYDDVVNQGVPTHITDLVRKLSEHD
jgi:hypothetical protein